MKALVTGAAREGGIGRAIVARLEAEGMEVLTLDVEPGCTFQADVVSDELPVLDDIDVLVCNAALTTMFGAAHSFKLERWQRDIDVNLTGTLRVVQACLPGMRERRYGRIVVISSTAAVHGMPAQISYSTTKAGLLGFAKTLAADDLGPGRLFVANGAADGIDRFVDDVIGPLLTGEDGTADLLRTLHVFYDTGRSVRLSAARLGIHENTVRYRLARVHSLTGLDVAADAGDQLTVQMSLLVLRLQGHAALPSFEEGE